MPSLIKVTITHRWDDWVNVKRNPILHLVKSSGGCLSEHIVHGFYTRREYLLILVRGLSCEGQERPLNVLKEHQMYGEHVVCSRWKSSDIAQMLSLHLPCTGHGPQACTLTSQQTQLRLLKPRKRVCIFVIWSQGKKVKTLENLAVVFRATTTTVLIQRFKSFKSKCDMAALTNGKTCNEKDFSIVCNFNSLLESKSHYNKLGKPWSPWLC